MDKADVAIVGGGVIGLTTAYFLAREGARVTLLDRGDFGQEASWAGAGILSPSSLEHARTPFDRIRALSLSLFPALSQELHEITGIDNGYLRCGGIEFAGPPDAAEEEWGGAGTTRDRVSAADLAGLEPAASTSLGDVWHLPDMAQVRNPRHVKALVAACSAKVRLVPHCPVTMLETSGDRVIGVCSKADTFQADKVLVASGAWTDEILGQIGWRPGIRPIRGQIALLQTPKPLLRRVLAYGASYVVPRADGRLLVGSTEENVGFDKRTTAEAIQRLLALATKLAPALAGAAVEHCWAGLRPASPDGLPFIGLVPGWRQLYVAAGHFRAGIQLSVGTALVMSDLLAGREPRMALDAYRLDRASLSRNPGQSVTMH
jgi:glycine oxidase